MTLDNKNKDYIKSMITGHIDTVVGKVGVVDSGLKAFDHFGSLKARLNINRNNYMIKPGLYAVGTPDATSPVLVTANYKLSFDHLRKELSGINSWIMVLDTFGINVWCAAGKGTFGTEEIIRQVNETGIGKIVQNKKLIVPQLGAPGVSAFEVAKRTGFKVIYGPVRSSDIPEFLRNGLKANEEMRRVKFNLYDRSILVPVEIVLSLKYIIVSIILFSLLSGFSSSGYSVNTILTEGTKAVIILAFAVFAGTTLGPIFLPVIPGRAFSLKGFFAGSVIFLLAYLLYPGFSDAGIVENVSWFLLIGAISSFLTMNFTGTSTYTSLSGVKKEMKYAVPLQAACSVLGLTLWIISRFI